jgi:aspartate aminotransferase
MQLAKRLETISEPQTIKMAKLSRELKAKGINVVDLSLGEPDFKTPEHICNAAIKAMQDGFTKYPPVAGFPDFKEAISIKLKRDNNLHYTSNEIIISTGAKQSLANAILCLIDEDDEAIIPAPYWVTYASLVQFAGGKVNKVSCTIENDFKITPEQLEAAITPQTKLFIFSSPCNPTGSVYSRAELGALAEIFKKYPQVAIISDEIYEYINFAGGHESIAQFDELRDRVVIVNGMSKGFAMTGWRLGYLAGPAKLVEACDKLQAQFTSGANSVAQKAAITALLDDLAPTYTMVDAFKKRRDYVIGALKKMPGVKTNVPDGAFYAFPDISAFFGTRYENYTINNNEDMSMYLLNHAHVSSVTGSAFGDDNCIRLSFATSMDNLMLAMERLEKALKMLSPVPVY